MDADEIQRLYEQYGHVVFGRCLRILGDPADAEEALQEVFLRALRSREGFRAEASPMTWLTRIATNHCLNVLRTRRRRHRDAHEPLDADRASDAALVQRGQQVEDISAVRAVLTRFPRQTQEIAVYYFVDGMNQEEVAALVGVSLPTLRKRLREFVERSRRLLGGAEPEGAR